MLKRIKRDICASLDVTRVENLMRIGQEGPPIELFDPIAAMEHWADQVVRRPAQSKCKRSYKTRVSKSTSLKRLKDPQIRKRNMNEDKK